MRQRLGQQRGMVVHSAGLACGHAHDGYPARRGGRAAHADWASTCAHHGAWRVGTSDSITVC
jgi:hypothetical protein